LDNQEKEQTQEPDPYAHLTKTQALKSDLYFWLQSMVTALVTLILVFTLLGRVIGVDGSSMLPTLRHGELLILQSIGYTPAQGDVVVLYKPFKSITAPIVKRVIAVGGQTVSIDYNTSTVYVDGQALEEPYINESIMSPPTWDNITSITVPEGHIFVMGDNRNHSSDSRDPELGVIDVRYVLGCARLVVFPLDRFGPVHAYPMTAA